jgi:hypothetical protein
MELVSKNNTNMLGRLRGYDTDSRERTFNYDGTKRFGDFDGGWKRYHWCKSQFLGYEDDANTFYIVPDIHGSTKDHPPHTLPSQLVSSFFLSFRACALRL